MKFFNLLSLGIWAWVMPVAAQPETAAQTVNIVVFDASGSMWNQMEDSTRIEIAREVMGQFLEGYDTAQPLGVIAYGHRKRGDCEDIEILVQPANIDPAEVSKQINALLPKGKTPLAESLRRAGAMIPKTAEDANILLITDGLETCGGDPCAVAKEMIAEGIKVRAHVVGFGLTKAEADSLACIAQLTGGRIFNPSNGEELLDALKQSVTAEAAVEPEPEPEQMVEETFEVVINLKDVGFGLPSGWLTWTATDAEGKARELRMHEGRSLKTELPAGEWTVTAVGVEGKGEGRFSVSRPSRPYIDFTAAQVEAEITNTAPMTAGVTAYISFRIITPPPGDSQSHFTLGIFPKDDPLTRIVAAGSNRYVFAGQKIQPGDYRASVAMPKEPGTYKLALLRRGAKSAVLAERMIEVVAVPELKLEVPERVVAGSVFEPKITSGSANYDRLTLFAMKEDGTPGRQISDVWYSSHWQSNEGLIDAPAEPGRYLLKLTARTADRKNSPETSVVVNVVSAEEFSTLSGAVPMEEKPAEQGDVEPVLTEASAPMDPKAKIDVRLMVPGLAADAPVTWTINPLEADGKTLSRDGRMGGGGNTTGGDRAIGLEVGKWKLTAKSGDAEYLLVADVEPGKAGKVFTLDRQFGSGDVKLDVAESVTYLPDGFFPIHLEVPEGFKGVVSLHTEANRDGEAVFETDAAELAGATDSVMPMPAGPGVYELKISDSAGNRLLGIPFEVTAVDAPAAEAAGAPELRKFKGNKFGTGTVMVEMNGGTKEFVTTREVVKKPPGTHENPEVQKFLDSMDGKVIDTAVLRSVAGTLYVSLDAYGPIGDYGPHTLGNERMSFEVGFALDPKSLELKPGSRKLSYNPPGSKTTENQEAEDFELKLDSMAKHPEGGLRFKGSFSGTLTKDMKGKALERAVPVKGTFDVLHASGNDAVGNLLRGN